MSHSPYTYEEFAVPNVYIDNRGREIQLPDGITHPDQLPKSEEPEVKSNEEVNAEVVVTPIVPVEHIDVTVVVEAAPVEPTPEVLVQPEEVKTETAPEEFVFAKTPPPNLSYMLKADLIDLASKLNQDTSGTKDEIYSRLVKYYEQFNEPISEEPAETGGAAN